MYHEINPIKGDAITIYYIIEMVLNKYIVSKVSFKRDIVDDAFKTNMSRSCICC